MKKLMLGCGVLRSSCAVGMMALAATAAMAETVAYLDYDAVGGTFTNATAECTVVTSETTAFANGGWYVAKGTNTCNKITVSGSAHLILADGAELTINNGIRVSEGNSLTIYEQDEGSGKLIANGGRNGYPGIGGGLAGESCGAITVNGGSVVAESNGGVGIGGVEGKVAPFGDGGSGGNGGSLTVNGGSVTTSKKIGGGAGGFGGTGNAGSPGRGTRVTLMGGVTEAQGGIFTDGDPDVATNMKVEGAFNEASYIKVAEAKGPNTRDVVFVLGEGVIGITTDFAGDCLSDGNRITLKDAKVGAQIGIEVTCAPGFEYRGATEFVVRADESPHELNAVPIPVEVLESVEYAVPGESTLSVARNVATVVPGPHTFTNGGWYVTRSKWSCGVIEVNGSANLILADGAELTVDGGIRVTEGNSLTIYGQSEGSGKLIVTGAEGCAGIGGGCGVRGSDSLLYDFEGGKGGSGGFCGIVTINGGSVSATGGDGAAGVGGGMGGVGGSGCVWGEFFIVDEGFVRGDFCTGGAGGIGGAGGCVTVNGGTVTAIGGSGAAGIGGGAGGSGGVGGCLLLEDEDCNGGIGGGGGAGGSLKITGGTVTVSWLGGGAGGNGGPCLGRSAIPGEAGAKGSGGAGAAVTFLGGVTEAQNGIFTVNDPTLEANVEVSGQFNVAERILVFDVSKIILGCADHPWKAGDGITGYTNGMGRLVIQGAGAMSDFASAASVPWAAVVDDVTEVTIAEGVTHVGKNALAGMNNLVSINAENVESTYLTVSTVNAKSIEQFNMMGEALGNAPLVYPLSEPDIPDNMLLVSQTEIQAAKAEAVTVADGVVSLGVTVNTNGNFTAETKGWAPVELTSDNVEVKDGKIVISIPVSDKSGFMILQSGDAKVGVTSGGGPAANHAVQLDGGRYLDGEAEDQVEKIGGVDTRVLGNTAEKANDNSSDK